MGEDEKHSIWGHRGRGEVWEASQKVTVELDFESLKMNLSTKKRWNRVDGFEKRRFNPTFLALNRKKK